MRVKVRAVILRDGRLVVSRESRRGLKRLFLPGGRVQDRESITDALIREVGEETGLEIAPRRLLYVAEVVGGPGVHDLNLVWLAEPLDPEAEIPDEALIPLDGDLALSMMPPITEQIRTDAAAEWANTPRWLGNILLSWL